MKQLFSLPEQVIPSLGLNTDGFFQSLGAAANGGLSAFRDFADSLVQLGNALTTPSPTLHAMPDSAVWMVFCVGATLVLSLRIRRRRDQDSARQ